MLNNTQEAKKRLFHYPNMVLTLSEHKHLDDAGRSGNVMVIATLGSVVPQDPDNENGRAVTHQLVSIA